MILILLVIENVCHLTYITSPPTPRPAPQPLATTVLVCFNEIGFFFFKSLIHGSKTRLISHTVF